MSGQAFVPPRDPRFYLLKAHRQPLPANIAAHFIERFTSPGDLLIDPFVASDAIVRAALERGRRIIAADSNPLVAWIARIQTTLPPAREIHAAFVRLGETRKEGGTLRAFIEKLYASQCAECGSAVSVDYFAHRRAGDKTVLAEKVYTCPNHGARRDAANEADRQRAADATPSSLNYQLLLQRLIGDDVAHTRQLKALLELYTPRSLVVLAALTQKLDADFRSDAARNTLAAMMLHALDLGTTLYATPDAQPVRETPEEFVEMNLWGVLEAAARGLGEHAPALRLAANPAQVVGSTNPAAFVGAGGARYLTENAGEARAALILASPARLDPAFWELSFLWTRWLLGRTAAAPLESLLEEKRQRWSWYGEALTNALAEVSGLALPGAPFVVAFPSGSHAMIEALMLAASSDYAFQDLAFRPLRGAARSTEFGAVRGDYQVLWQQGAQSVAPLAGAQVAPKLRIGSLQAAREILEARGEPSVYSWLHHAALVRLARSGALAETLNAKYREGDNAFQFLRHRMEEGFKEGYIHDLDHWEDKERVLWMSRENAPGDEGKASQPPLAERVEQMVSETLRGAGRMSAEQLEDAVLQAFPALLTPEIELVEICARAYADLKEGEWVWRADERKTKLAAARELLAELGVRLGFQVGKANPPFDVLWRSERVIPGSASGAMREERLHEDAFRFVLRARADFPELLELPPAPARGLIVIPESQVELTRERLRREPRWTRKLERAGWDFLRVPFIELLLRGEAATRPEFQLAWGIDPPLAQGGEQLELF